MATLLLTAVGSAFGPIGGAIGALVGRSIDSRLFGSAGKEGPRLKELNVSGSSYGTPIARHFGIHPAEAVQFSTQKSRVTSHNLDPQVVGHDL